MGIEFVAKCNNCGHKFNVSSGGGKQFELLHCTKCANTKEVSRHKIFKEIDKQENKKDEDKIAAEIAGKCRCGGQFKIEAPPRCPKCQSKDIEKEKDILYYD